MSFRNDVRKKLRLAKEYRMKTLSPGQTVFRLSAGAPDDLEGLIIDCLGEIIWIRCYAEESVPLIDTVCEVLEEEMEGSRFFTSVPAARQASLRFGNRERGSMLEIEVHEASGSYLIAERPADDFGLYTDSAAARHWVLHNACDCKVLNLFAYTCGFGVAALRAGASTIWNVDVSRDYLTWGRRNAQLNGGDFSVYPDDCLDHLRRRARRVNAGSGADCLRPNLVILDPPAFLRGRGSERVTRNVIGELIDLSLSVSSSGATLLVSCNDAYQNRSGRFEDLLMKTLTRGAYGSLGVESLGQSVDVLGQHPSRADLFYLPSHFWVIRK